VEQLVAREAHNLEVAGSTPARATNFAGRVTVFGEETDARVNHHGHDIVNGKIRADYELRQHQATEKGMPDVARPLGIRERIDRALYAAQQTSRRAAVAHRAKQIIDQHPEFAELLDLLNDL
jgi:hypothetical protein